jgi:hypothetical protein
VGDSNKNLVFWNGYILSLYEIVNRNQKARRANKAHIQGVFEMHAQILTTSYWLHVELGKNI